MTETATTTPTALATVDLPAGELLRALPGMIVKRVPVPVLTAVRIVTSLDGPAAVEAFDYETSRTYTVPTGTLTPGAPFLVPAADLLAAVKGLTAGMSARTLATTTVRVAATSTGATVSAGGVTVPIVTPWPVDEYPDLPAPVAGPAFTTDLPTLSAAVGHVAASAMRPGEHLPVLEAVRMTADGTAVQLVSTDRYRAHRATVAATTSTVPADLATLVPARFLADVVKLLRAVKHDGPVVVTVDPAGPPSGMNTRRVQVSAGAHVLATVCHDGTFPALDRLWPTDVPVSGDVDAPALHALVKRAATLTTDKQPLLVQVRDGAMIVAVRPDDSDPVTVGAVATTAPDMDSATGVNAQYLADALAAHPGVVTFGHVAAGKPFTFTGPDLASLVMPVRVAGAAVDLAPAETVTPAATTAPVRGPRPARTTTPAVPVVDPRVAELTEQVARLAAQVADLQDALAAALAPDVPDNPDHQRTTSTATSTLATSTSTGGEHKHRALPGDDVPPRCACGFRQSRTPAPGRALSDHLARFAGR